jgi:hypothetical protein
MSDTTSLSQLSDEKLYHYLVQAHKDDIIWKIQGIDGINEFPYKRMTPPTDAFRDEMVSRERKAGKPNEEVGIESEKTYWKAREQAGEELSRFLTKAFTQSRSIP